MPAKHSIVKKCLLCSFKSEEILKDFTSLRSRPDGNVCWSCAAELGQKFVEHQAELQQHAKEALQHGQNQPVYAGGDPHTRRHPF